MSSFSSSTQFITSPDLVEQSLGSETIIYNPLDARAHCLDVVSSRIFCYCKQPRTLEEVAVEIALPTETTSTRLSELVSLGILFVPVEQDNEQSRRSFLKTLASAAAAATVLSVNVPAPSSAASCAADNTCSGNSEPLCTACSPPGCASIVTQVYLSFVNSVNDIQGGTFCTPIGINAFSCQAIFHAVNSDCLTAKTQAEASTADRNIAYYCCSATQANCITLAQCQDNRPAAIGLACCRGGNCTNAGTCV